MPEILTGLKLSDFAHPDDLKIMQSLSKVPGADKAMTFIEENFDHMDFSVMILGSCIRLTEENSPRPYKILRHVCQILDYPIVPEIYSTRSYSIDITIGGVETPKMQVPDFVLNHYDDSLLYFLFGRAITRFKSGYMKYYVASKLIMDGTAGLELIAEPVRMTLASWMRKSTMTADRGGLLACQSIKAAGRYMMNKAGMPIQETANVRIPDYLNACKIDIGGVKAGKTIQTISNQSGWTNDRLRELYNWYAEGRMSDIVEKYAD